MCNRLATYTGLETCMISQNKLFENILTVHNTSILSLRHHLFGPLVPCSAYTLILLVVESIFGWLTRITKH